MRKTMYTNTDFTTLNTNPKDIEAKINSHHPKNPLRDTKKQNNHSQRD